MSFKFTLGLLIGAAAGAVVMHYLNTKEGKAFAEKVKQDVCDAEEKVSEFANDIIEKGKSVIQNVEEQFAGKV